MLRLENIHMSYGRGAPAVVNGIDLHIEQGEFFTLLGPSGCGKTSTLRCIAGLETPTSGSIQIDGVTVYGNRPPVFTPPHRRDIAMVFQSYAIWPHMTVAQNVAFPLEAARLPRGEVRTRVRDALEMVGLADFANRSAPLLSGGQQQRVAFARAIVKGAKILLLDEPLSNLDAKLRTQMREELRTLQRRLGVTTVFVTHDQSEAMSMSDRIAVMSRGSVVAVGVPRDLYLTPPNVETARFIGQADLIAGSLVGTEGSLSLVQTAFGLLRCGGCADAPPRPVFVLVRPEHIRISERLPHENGAGRERPNEIDGRIATVTFSGRYCEYTVEAAGHFVRVESSGATLLGVGDPVSLEFPVDKCVVLTEGAPEKAADGSDASPSDLHSGLPATSAPHEPLQDVENQPSAHVNVRIES